MANRNIQVTDWETYVNEEKLIDAMIDSELEHLQIQRSVANQVKNYPEFFKILAQ